MPAEWKFFECCGVNVSGKYKLQTSYDYESSHLHVVICYYGNYKLQVPYEIERPHRVVSNHGTQKTQILYELRH